ncbi:MAG: hypothetical protein WCG85_08585 [Polyangia bacterium]
MTIPTSIAVMAIASGAAWAQETCPDSTLPMAQLPINYAPGYMDHSVAAACTAKYGGGNVAKGCFPMYGSDTLTQIVQNAINKSGACFSYHNTGSTQAERNMELGQVSSWNAYQGIGPMSRNTQYTWTAHPTYALTTGVDPQHGGMVTTDNVVALDEGVITFKNKAGACVDLDDAFPPNPPAACNNAIANGVSALAVIVAGNPASGTQSKGTTAECADPCRIWLVDYLASQSCQGVNRIEHIYRRDDKSGTQDTFREFLTNLNVPASGPPYTHTADGTNVQYWCNGKSEGNVNAPTSNLLDEDLDPIRRSCVPADSTHAQTRCTYYPTNQTCAATDPTILAKGSAKNYAGQTVTNPFNEPLPCTQGLIVALSESDPGSADITTSIGNRVASDGNGFSVGMAGGASITAPTPPNAHVNINTITTLPSNIYHGNYKFSRRLFLMRAVDSNGNPTFNDTLAAAGGDKVPGRTAEETTLWNYVFGNPCPMQDIAVAAGFLPKWMDACTDNCGSGGGPLAEANTLACLGAPTGVGTPKQNLGPGDACTASYPCVADGSVGTAGPPSTCSSGASVCAAIPALGSGLACNLNENCSPSGVCTDDSSGVGGTCN